MDPMCLNARMGLKKHLDGRSGHVGKPGSSAMSRHDDPGILEIVICHGGQYVIQIRMNIVLCTLKVCAKASMDLYARRQILDANRFHCFGVRMIVGSPVA